jgi:hypothetical protein
MSVTNERVHQITLIRTNDDEHASCIDVYLSMVPCVCTVTYSIHIADPNDASQC